MPRRSAPHARHRALERSARRPVAWRIVRRASRRAAPGRRRRGGARARRDLADRRLFSARSPRHCRWACSSPESSSARERPSPSAAACCNSRRGSCCAALPLIGAACAVADRAARRGNRGLVVARLDAHPARAARAQLLAWPICGRASSELGEIARRVPPPCGLSCCRSMARWPSGRIVDNALLSWTPALLMRRFAWSPGEVGASLGAIAIVAGLIGTPAGGLICDRVTARWGIRARFPSAACSSPWAGILGIPVGLLGTRPRRWRAPAVGYSSPPRWARSASPRYSTFCRRKAAGFGTSTIAFNNIIVGLGLGPTLVALVTDQIFHDPRASGTR